MAEECGERHAQHVFGLPQHDPGLDAVAVPQPSPAVPRLRDVDQDVDPLFLDSEGGDLRKAEGLDAPHLAGQRRPAAPGLDHHALTGLDPDCVRGQQVDHDLELLGIADLHQGRAGLNHALALLDHAQHFAADRGVHVHAGAVGGPITGRGRREQAGPGELVLGFADPAFRAGLGERCVAGAGTPLGCVELVLGHRMAAGERPDPLELGAREIRLRLCAAYLGLGQCPGGCGGVDAGAGLGGAADVEEGRIARLDACHHGLIGNDPVACLELDPPHQSRHRRRDYVHVANARLTLVTDADHQRAAFGRHEVHGDRRGTEQPRDGAQQRDRQRPPEHQSFARGRHRLTPGS